MKQKAQNLLVKSPSRYDDSFKRQVVSEVLEGHSQVEVARSYGIRIQLVSRWLDEHKKGISWAASEEKRLQVQSERARQAELQRLREEVDILKKATAYFAKHLK